MSKELSIVGLDEHLFEAYTFYRDNGLTMKNTREALVMDCHEFIESTQRCVRIDTADCEEYTDIWLANNVSQDELEGE